MNTPRLTENDVWLLNYYRLSEVNGALFFGRIARIVRGPLQVDVTHHFADEANHARYWTDCLDDLGHAPHRLPSGYQDQYLEVAGMPATLMEVLAITQVFEKRVIGVYRRHLRHPGTHPRVRQTIERIMLDERRHIGYVRTALEQMADKYGADRIEKAVDHFTQADREVYAKTIAEYGERFAHLTADYDLRADDDAYDDTYGDLDDAEGVPRIATNLGKGATLC